MARMHTVRSLILLAMVLTLGRGVCLAQDSDLKLQGVKSSWNAYSKPGMWGIQWVNVFNDSDSSVAVRVGPVIKDGKLGKIEYLSRAGVPAGMKRAIRVVYRTGELKARKIKVGHKTGTTTRYATADWANVLRDSDSGENLGRDVSPVIVLPARTVVFGLVRDTSLRHGSDSFIKALSMGAGSAGIITLAVKAQDLPDAWFGYSMIDVMIIAGFDPEKLMASQLEGLLQWVRRGGLLLITASDDLPKFLAGPIGCAAGVTATDTLWIDGFTVTGGKRPAKRSFVWPVPMAELCPTDAMVLLTADGLPLLTQRRVGNGWIFVLGTSLTAASPTKNFDIWKFVKNARQNVSAIDADAFITPVKARPVRHGVKSTRRKKGRKTPRRGTRDKSEIKSKTPQLSPAEQALNSIAGRRGPNKIVPVIIMLVMVVFVVVLGSFLRLKRRGEWLWVVLVPGAILTGVGMYVYSQSRVEPQRLSHIGLITSIAPDKARVQQVFAYNSGDRKIQPPFISGRDGVIRSMSESKLKTSQLSYVDTTPYGVQLPGKDVPQKSDTKFYVDSVMSVGGIGSALTFDSYGLGGTLTNQMNQPIKNAVIYVDRHCYALGKVSDGQVQVAVSDAQLLGSDEFVSGEVVIDKLRNDFMKKLQSLPKAGRTVDKNPVLIGYIDASVIDPIGSLDMQRQGWTAVVWPLNIIAPPSGTEVTIPSGFVQRKIRNIGSMSWNRATRSFGVFQHCSGGVILMVRAPRPIKAITAATVTLEVHIQANNYELVVSGVKLEDLGHGLSRKLGIISRTKIGSVLNPTGKYKFVVADAERFLTADGWYAVALEVRSIIKNAPTAEGKGRKGRKGRKGKKMMNGWLFRSVDAGLKGNVK